MGFNNNKNFITITLPSKGILCEQTISFLKDCGFYVHRANNRQYEGFIKNYNINVIFQRAEDIPEKIFSGIADIGITGRDIVREHTFPSDNILIPNLGFGNADLVVAVPYSWIHVQSVFDLAYLAKQRFLKKHIPIRIATKFLNLTKDFLYRNQIYYYNLVSASGVLEIAPKTGLADIIVDLASTGNTLKENHLKTLKDGTIFNSAACLIVSSLSRQSFYKQPIIKEFIDKIISHQQAKIHKRIMTNIIFHDSSSFEKNFQQQLINRNIFVKAFNIAKSLSLSSNNTSVINITLVVKDIDLYKAITLLQEFDASDIAVSEIEYLFSQDNKL